MNGYNLKKSLFLPLVGLALALPARAADLPALTVRAISTSMVYGSELSLVGLQFVASIDGTNGTQVATGIDVAFKDSSGGAVDPSTAPAGTYDIVLSNIQGLVPEEFSSITYENGMLTVAKRKITILPDELPKKYGQNYRLNGDEFVIQDEDGRQFDLPGDDSVDWVNLTCEGVAPKAPYKAGGYDIQASDAEGAGLENYDITYGTGTLYVAKCKITITANNATNAYGQVSQFTGTEFTVAPETLPNNDRVETVALTNLKPVDTGVGEYANVIVPSHVVAGAQFNTNNYDITFVEGALTVTQAVLTIRVNSTNRVYGTTLALTGKEFTTLPAVLPNGETVDRVTLTSTKAGDPAAKVQDYPQDIVLGGIAASTIDPKNYAIAFSNGTLTVTQAPLTIIANNAKRVYGATLAFTGKEFATEPKWLPNGETVESVTITSAKAGDATTPAGEYAGEIVPSHVVTGIDTNNYDIVFSNGTLTVEKAPLALKAADATKTYGESKTFTGTEFSISGGMLYNGDTVDSVTLASDGAAATAKWRAEGCSILPSAAQGTGLANYDIAYEAGKLKIEKFALTITANDVTNCYGEATAFSGTEFSTAPTTLPNDERVETVKLTNSKPVGAEVGEYRGAIVPSLPLTGINANNYQITFSNGTLTVTQAVLTVAAKDVRWTVGQRRPDYDLADLSGQLKAGDVAADITGGDVTYTNAVWTADRTPTDADAGTYSNEIWVVRESLTGSKVGNYAIEIAPGDLTIAKESVPVPDKPTLHVYALSTGKAYGDDLAMPALAFIASIDGTNGAQVATGIDVAFTDAQGQAAYPTNAAASVGAYAIRLSNIRGLDVNEFSTVVYHPGTLTVTPAALTISVNDASWRVGRPRPANGVADFSDQLKAGDAMADVLGDSVAYTNAVWNGKEPQAADVGTYPDEIWIDCARLAGTRTANYQIAVRPGTLTVESSVDGRLSDHAADASTSPDVTLANVYDGYLYRDDAVTGTIQVKIAKANRKTGLSKLTATVVPGSGKKITVSGTFDPDAERFVATAKDGTVLDVVIGKDGLFGTFGDSAVEGARNRYSSKAAEDKAVVEAASKWTGVYALAYETEAGLDALSVTVGKKGSVKVVGALATGTAISQTAKMIIGPKSCGIPVYSLKKQLSLCVWLSDDGLEVTGVDGAVIGRATDLVGLSALSMDAADVAALDAGEGAEILTDYLPEGAEILPSGKKWIALPDENGKAMRTGRLVWDRKAGRIDFEKSKIDGYNVSGLKLTFAEKKGTFAGSFKIYSVAKNSLKSTTATVKGVVIDGIGYGMAFAKKIGNMRLMLRAKADQE